MKPTAQLFVKSVDVVGLSEKSLSLAQAYFELLISTIAFGKQKWIESPIVHKCRFSTSNVRGVSGKNSVPSDTSKCGSVTAPEPGLSKESMCRRPNTRHICHKNVPARCLGLLPGLQSLHLKLIIYQLHSRPRYRIFLQ
jgi:hypothetical protein